MAIKYIEQNSEQNSEQNFEQNSEQEFDLFESINNSLNEIIQNNTYEIVYMYNHCNQNEFIENIKNAFYNKHHGSIMLLLEDTNNTINEIIKEKIESGYFNII